VRHLVAAAGLVKLFLPPFLGLPEISTRAAGTSGDFGGLIPFITPLPTGSAAAAGGSHEAIAPAAVLLVLWAVIVLAKLAAALSESIGLALRLRGAQPVPEDQLPRLPGAGRMRVLVSDMTAVPMTLAFLPGRIFVPEAWKDWNGRCREMVLLHEVAHVRRRDGLILMLQIIARAIYFFHPLVALLDRRISAYREMACDDATVGPDRDSSAEYSRYLVEIAGSVVRCPAACGSASALIRRKNELLARVRYQLEEGRMSSFSKARSLLLAALIALAAASLSWHRGGASTDGSYPDQPPPPEPPKQESAGGMRRINVLLQSDGTEVDGKSVGMQALGEVLAGIAGDDPGGVMISLVCDSDVPMGQVRIFHEILTEGGIDKIRYLNDGGEGHPIQLPPKKALERLEELPVDLIVDVSVTAGGGLVVGTRKIEPEKLTAEIKGRLEQKPFAVVVIHNMQDTTYGDFVRALGLVREAGAERIAIRFAEE
jgi:beta-lactamase regulating signal transducer with metallopeptidase domain/biopolymer transport protein ExbD